MTCSPNQSHDQCAAFEHLTSKNPTRFRATRARSRFVAGESPNVLVAIADAPFERLLARCLLVDMHCLIASA
jgi:hypothetical protein